MLQQQECYIIGPTRPVIDLMSMLPYTAEFDHTVGSRDIVPLVRVVDSRRLCNGRDDVKETPHAACLERVQSDLAQTYHERDNVKTSSS